MRRTSALRDLVRETELSPKHLIQPLFVVAGEEVRDEIPSMPGIERFSINEVVAEANRLPYGLAAYAFTRSAKTANAIAAEVETGMMTINHFGLALPEVPFGGVKDSGYGTEGGADALEPYLVSKFVSQAGI